MTFIQYVFGIRSMRQTIKEIETNMAYRWVLGFGFHTEVRISLPSVKIMSVASKTPIYLNRFSIVY